LPIFLSDEEIQTLINEKKPLSSGFLARILVRPKRGHKERELPLIGNDKSEFRLIIRQSLINILDFSVILAYSPPKLSGTFRLRRYNGKSHEHTNIIERNKFYDFHIHTATERYQQMGLREDYFAEPTDRFSDLNGALSCMFDDCGFVLPKDKQMHLNL
jgi:hypothetical protein